MPFTPQDDSEEDIATQGDSAAISHALEGTAAQGDSEAASHAPEGNSAHARSTFLSKQNRRKRRRRASSVGTQRDISSFRGYKAARAIRKTKGKQAQTADLSDGNQPPMAEAKSIKSPQESRDLEVEPRVFCWGFCSAIC